MISFRSRALRSTFFLLGAGPFASLSVTAQSSASLHGRAVDTNGKPLTNAVVQLVSDQTAHGGHAWRYTLMGDSLGKFSQEGLAPGAYLVMLFTEGKGTNVLRNVQLKAGEARAIDLILAPTVQLVGTLSTDEKHRISAQTR